MLKVSYFLKALLDSTNDFVSLKIFSWLRLCTKLFRVKYGLKTSRLAML